MPKNSSSHTAVMYAAEFNPNPEVITALLKAGADANTKNRFGMTALMYAAKVTKNPEVIITLLKAGADTKVKDRDGNTALDYTDVNDNLAGTDALKQLEEASK
jgi:ankyrin repeat protein